MVDELIVNFNLSALNSSTVFDSANFLSQYGRADPLGHLVRRISDRHGLQMGATRGCGRVAKRAEVRRPVPDLAPTLACRFRSPELQVRMNHGELAFPMIFIFAIYFNNLKYREGL